MNATQQKAYDALGRVQRYYETHEVATGVLWRNASGTSVVKANGEVAACIWGAMIAVGYRTKGDYNAGQLPIAMQQALYQGRPGGPVIRGSVVGINDGVVSGDKLKMRQWLRQARAALKKGLA